MFDSVIRTPSPLWLAASQFDTLPVADVCCTSLPRVEVLIGATVAHLIQGLECTDRAHLMPRLSLVGNKSVGYLGSIEFWWDFYMRQLSTKYDSGWQTKLAHCTLLQIRGTDLLPSPQIPPVADAPREILPCPPWAAWGICLRCPMVTRSRVRGGVQCSRRSPKYCPAELTMSKVLRRGTKFTKLEASGVYSWLVR